MTHHLKVSLHILSLNTYRAAVVSGLMAAGLVSGSGLSVAKEKQRIVVAGGMITEVIYALGASDRIVGVDTTSLFPSHALKTHPNIGYVRSLSTEGILSLKPTSLYATSHAGPPSVLTTLREAGLKVMQLPEPHSAKDILSNIDTIGRWLGKESAASHLSAKIGTAFSALAEKRTKIKNRKRVLFVLSLRNGRIMAAGRNTSVSLVLSLAGARNAVSEFEGFKPVSNEAIVRTAPDVILTMKRADTTFKKDDFLYHPAIKITPAGIKGNILAMDGLYLLGLGPRTPAAARELMSLLYKR